MNIPVIGTAVVNSVFWVERLLLSIDYPTDNFVIFNNNGKGELDEKLELLKKIEHKYVKKITVCHMPANIGVSGAWNLIIKCYMNAPYWIITNDDISFSPGFLEEMVEVSNDSEVGMVHGNGGDFNDGSWDLFLIKDWVIQSHGLFDENLYPAYCEDADYIMRLQVNPIKRIPQLNHIYYHGTGLSTEYYEHGSQTKKAGTEEFAKKLNFSNESNFKYMYKKWGKDWRMTNPTKTPFDIKEMPITTTTYDLEFVRKKYLGF